MPELSDVALHTSKPDSQNDVVFVSTSRRRVTPTSSSSTNIERLLPNGDIYIGAFAPLGAPNGLGKYVWADGCMYEGDWRKGKASGRGKFSWPSGATYEGDFKTGRMDGSGTFVGSDGDTYSGAWSADRKHGIGLKHYSNGDSYQGAWKKNLQDGHGKYTWRNGNEYSGEWKSGVISGRGGLRWANGNKYDGEWECGAPKGNGIFTWPDGSCYVGNYEVLNGTFYAAEGGKEERFDDDVRGVTLPRICIWESDGEAGDITCDIVDTVEMCRNSETDSVRQFKRGLCCLSGEVKRPGEAIAKGHKNYDLMLNLQLGIRYSIGKHGSVVRELKPSDFDPKEKFWTRFPPEGSNKTPPHQSFEFRWKDYCPRVFRRLRELFQVDPADYMLAICGNDALRELSSPGKSGSFFYTTQDDRFMIKTVKKSEVKVLIRMLTSYYRHMSRYDNSLVTKFYGVHCVKPVGGQKTRFIVMGNLFCSEYRIHRRFDLKGSSHGRTTDKAEGEIDEITTLKDLDLNFVFRLQGKWYQELIKQINLDCEFLEAERIMDYSLLVGLHFYDGNKYDKMALSPCLLRSGAPGLKDSFQNEKFIRGCRFLEAELQEMDRALSGRKPRICLGANMPARAERLARRSDFDQYTAGGFSHLTPSRSCEMYDVVLYFGIIDILQDYDISKKLEHAYKSFQVNSTSISAVDPKHYSKRFRDFIGRVFMEDR